MDVRTEAQWSIWSNWSECDACGEGQFRSQGFLKVDLSLSLIDFVYTCFILSFLTIKASLNHHTTWLYMKKYESFRLRLYLKLKTE